MKKQVPSTSSSSSSTIKKRNIIGRSSFIEPKALSRSTINTTTNTNLTSSTTNRISSNNNISTPLSSNNNQQILENESISSASRANEIFSVGEKIYLHGLKKWGTVKYFGDALFSDGKWVGVELNEEIGRNDGTVQGHRYFTCKPKYGVFVRPSNCSKASNVPASTPRSSSATPNVRLTNRSTIRASVPNALHSSLMRNIEPEMKVNEPTEIDSPSNNKYTEDIEPSLPESPPLSSQKIRTEEIDINQLLLSDEFIQRVTEKILENNSNIRNNLTVITPHKNHSENETIDSNVNNRIVSLEQSLVSYSFLLFYYDSNIIN